MTPEQLCRLIVTVADAVIEHTDEFTALDQAIGDGDHGLNMKRGFEAVRTDAAALAAKPLPEALDAIGLQLVMKIGGASGPLYGTLLMAMGKVISADGANISAAFTGGVEAVKARGKSQAGQKTMLDVLVRIEAVMSASGPDLPHRLPAIAQAAAEATVAMEAIRGRASFLGARSVGHMDPGACSSALIIAAVCRALED